jgi:hypothetical protein
MTPSSPVISPAHLRGSSRESDVSRRRRRARSRHEQSSPEQLLLGRYVDREGHGREVIARAGAAGSTLVVDRDGATGEDPRLVAHIGADEASGNAALVCSRYLQDAARGDGGCRALTAEDRTLVPFDDPHGLDVALLDTPAAQPVDRRGFAYSLELVPSAMSIPELRWCRRGSRQAPGCEPVSVREAIASLESYEPVRALTLRSLLLHGHGGAVSTTVLRAELARVHESPIVLNRRLREVVLATVERQQLSMSEIALRCGRVKRDRKGNESGETSWLARRVGLLPEGGRDTPTPWIHSDVLALIARHGLGVSPREVELC